MIASAGFENRDLWLFVVGLAALTIYGVLRLKGRDPVLRGPSPSSVCLPQEALLLILAMLFLRPSLRRLE